MVAIEHWNDAKGRAGQRRAAESYSDEILRLAAES
jgi:hypothetical protein